MIQCGEAEVHPGEIDLLPPVLHIHSEENPGNVQVCFYQSHLSNMVN